MEQFAGDGLLLAQNHLRLPVVCELRQRLLDA